MINDKIAKKAGQYVELWVSLAKQGTLPTEMPSFIHEEYGDFVSLNDFYNLTRESKDDDIRAKYDVGVSCLNRYMRETMIDAATAEEGSEKSKVTTATANILKTLSKEIGWDNKENLTKDDSANFQLRLEVDSEMLGFMQKSGLIKIENPELLSKIKQTPVDLSKETSFGKKNEPEIEDINTLRSSNPLVKEF